MFVLTLSFALTKDLGGFPL